jgi:hypothetical protein
MAQIKGKNVTVIADIETAADAGTYSGTYKPIGQATEHSISLSRAADETTTKDSGNYKGKDYGMGEASGSISGLLFFQASTIGPEELLAAQVAGKKVKLIFIYVKPTAAPLSISTGILAADVDGVTSFDTGTQQITVVAVLTSIEKSGSVEGKATYSVSYEVDGAPVIGAVAAS